MSAEAAALDVRRELAAGSRRGAAFARLLRPATSRTPVLVLLAAGLGETMGTGHVFGAVLLVVASYGVATIANDLADVDIDIDNGRTDRPLVTGDLAPADARAARLVCVGAVTGAQLLLAQPLGLAVTAAALAVGVAYSHPRLALQRRGLWGTVVLAGAYFTLPVALAGARLAPPLVAALLAGGAASVLHKDSRDEAGDRAHGKATPLVRHGAAAVHRLGLLLGLGGVVAGLVHAGPGWWTVAAAIAVVAHQARADRAGRPAAIAALVLLAATA